MREYRYHGIHTPEALEAILIPLIEKHQEAIAVFRKIAAQVKGVIDIPIQDYEATLNNALQTEIQEMWRIYCRTNEITPVNSEEQAPTIEALQAIKDRLQTLQKALKTDTEANLASVAKQSISEITSAIRLLEKYAKEQTN
jgi:hypothetical protein